MTNDKTDKQQIEQTIQLFIDGWAVGDAEKAGKALHENWRIQYFRDNKFTDTNRSDYLSQFVPKERFKDLKFRIISIDITNNIAMAKTEIINETSIFIDYLSLIKTNEGWFIVDKITNKANKN
jgi:Putative lumazine-binding